MTKKRWTFRQLQRAGQQLLERHGLNGWRFDVENLSNTNLYADLGPDYCRVGTCIPYERRISLDAEWSFGRPRAWREIRHTILHEIAHALVGHEHGHDSLWASKAKEIGCSPQFVASCKRRVEDPRA